MAEPWQRAAAGRARVARAGAQHLAAAGMHAQVVDPSFGDGNRKLITPLHGGYQLHVTPPHPADYQGEALTSWHAEIQPPGVDYHVAGEEVHRAELGVFHPRELHSRVQEYLGRPDVMAAIGHDETTLTGTLLRQQRNRARAATIAGFTAATADEQGGTAPL